jgi:putative endonuclease
LPIKRKMGRDDLDKWCVYILECKDKTLYTGITNNLAERLDKHNKGKASKYTRGRIPVTLQYQEDHPDKPSALQREYQLKQLPRITKLKLIARKCKA